MAVASLKFLEGSANCASHVSPSLLMGPKLREFLICLTDTNHVVAVGVFFFFHEHINFGNDHQTWSGKWHLITTGECGQLGALLDYIWFHFIGWGWGVGGRGSHLS